HAVRFSHPRVVRPARRPMFAADPLRRREQPTYAGWMSTHIGAPAGAVAPVVLLPGDPMRAKWIAETFLTGAERYNEVRGMYGYTGTWRGRCVSVQGTGMGQPSASIYATELLEHYGALTLIRVGSCGAMVDHVGIP